MVRFLRFGFGLSGGRGGGCPVWAAARNASSIETGYSDSFSRFEVVLGTVLLTDRLSFVFMRKAAKWTHRSGNAR